MARAYYLMLLLAFFSGLLWALLRRPRRRQPQDSTVPTAHESDRARRAELTFAGLAFYVMITSGVAAAVLFGLHELGWLDLTPATPITIAPPD